MSRKILTPLVFFILGLLVMYLIGQRQLKNTNGIAFKAITNYQAGLVTSNDLITNCSSAYNLITSCVSNLEKCDLPKETKELERLNTDKIQLQGQLNEINKNAGQILEEAKRVLQK